MHDDRGIDDDEKNEGSGNSSDNDHDARGLKGEEKNTPDRGEDEGTGGQEYTTDAKCKIGNGLTLRTWYMIQKLNCMTID